MQCYLTCFCCTAGPNKLSFSFSHKLTRVLQHSYLDVHNLPVCFITHTLMYINLPMCFSTHTLMYISSPVCFITHTLIYISSPVYFSTDTFSRIIPNTLSNKITSIWSSRCKAIFKIPGP